MQLNKECLEELNSITYENSNYGQVWSSRSCHVSRTNRMALATNRCLFVLNMSLEWPSKLKTSCAQKYLNRLSSSAAEPTGSNRMHIEQWIQDLRDVRNASFFANVITFAPRSTRLVDVYKRLLFADRIAECQVDGSSGISSSKRKSFYQQMLEKMRNANNNYNSLIDNNREQFSVHKSLSEQNLMFDPVYFEYVSHLVLQQHIQGSKNAELLDGYKLCMWNSRADRHLLASLTRSNQLIIFDCTLLSVSNQQNTPPSHPDESKTYTHVFDTTTGSACFDLTEFWLAEYKETLIPSVASASSSLEENMTYLDLVVPVCFVWAHNPIRFLHNDATFVVDLLFVAFKSNEIACFLVYDHLKVKTLTTINLSKHDRKREENDEEVNENLVKSGRFLITSLHFTHDERSQGLLSIGLSDGRSFITKLSITKDRILETLNDPKYTLVENTSSINELELLPQIESVIKFELTPIGISSSYLGVILVESCVKIALLDILDDNEAKIRIKHKLTDRLEYSTQDDDNSLIQGHFRVIDFKLIPESTKKPSYDLILTFRNSLIDTIKLSIIGSKIELSKVSSDLRLSDCKCKSDLFKSTRQVFLSTNRCLMFQIVDFSKSILVQKQPPQFQVNVFHVKNNQSLSIFSDYYSTNPERTVAEQSDYLWYFKQMLYLNHDKLMSMIYQEFYDKLKEIKLESGETKKADKDRYLSELKRMRILTSFFAEYYETVSSFEAYNLQQLSLSVGEAETSDEDNDDDDDEESMSSEEEANKAAKRRRRQRQTAKTIPIPISQPIDQSNDNVVKSPDYYKSMHREITLLIFRYHCLRVVQIADSIGFDRLTSRERLLAAFMKDFALKKNFISEKKKSKSEVTASQNELKCDICSRKFNFASSLELNRIECESGHLMARCEKTLFPLDNFKFKKCFSCNSLWNYLKPQDFPHFDFLVSSVDYCLFCN